MPGPAENDAGAVRDAAGGMRSQIFAAQIGFGLYNDAGVGTVDQDLTQQAARNLNGWAVVESAFEDGAEGHGPVFQFYNNIRLFRKSPSGKALLINHATIHGARFTRRCYRQDG